MWFRALRVTESGTRPKPFGGHKVAQSIFDS